MDPVLEQIIKAIEPMDLAKAAECYQRLASLTIRQDSKLSYLAGRIAGVQQTLHPETLQKAIAIFAADHAVDGGENKTQGKTSKADALEIAGGRGAINKVAHRIGAGVMLLDMGLEDDLAESQGVQNLKVMHGSHFWARRDAMSEDEMMDALFSGLQLGENLAEEGYTAVGLGNIGERALLTAFIITAAFFRGQLEDLPASMTSGKKLDSLKRVMEEMNFDPENPLDLLRRAGSPDIAAMVGFILSAARCKMLVVFDNAVTGAAVLLARALCPTVEDYVCPSAQYQEPVHQMQMKKLGLKPFVELEQNLDQGMGSAMGLTMLDAAVQMMNDNLK
ncbi:nicotinate-nucleotide--dimethylbenzimidazole phosphoribosyltransferase [Megasphaera massiliensis]|uniref:nicotinate-nucleotide--dimethylbenzimidazole phosphoribosyltransferase n=1 Tax=Megasphaera massiliensis TaxID=1232428 RepID=UPI00041865A8|nr:nicotinate-nucleotide--dimethylbenzimidazole phosphoribosyltransferase [Megasphaera massiliensis]MBS6256799.1 nicotinate-nucleotide--dimethylbenzimidazole phosphoribosyltransferase [Megasphaera sp.]